MSRREYKNPPVHEVVLNVQFHGALDDTELNAVREALDNDQFGSPARAQVVQISGALVGGGSPNWSTNTFFRGWDFGEQDPNWLLRVYRSELSLHQVRQGEGVPEGEYLGWDSIADRFSQIHEVVDTAYRQLAPRRVGVRYVNRVVLPQGPPLGTWFEIVPQPPPRVEDVRAFDLAQTWTHVGEDERFGATIRLAKIELPPDAAQEHYGVLLDIDVFNVLVKNAPESFDDVPDWLRAAHDIENDLFEDCITDDLRSRFDADR